MYFVATLQPSSLTEKEKDEGFLITAEKREATNKFYKTRLEKEIPLCIEHGTGEEYGYVVESDKRVGRVLDLFVDEEGHSVVKCVLYKENEHYQVIRDAIENNKEKWGVSEWIDIFRETPESEPQKELTHVALTTSPYFADRNTFIHHWSLNEDALDRVIAKEYYIKDKGECYASNEYIEKLDTLKEQQEEVSSSQQPQEEEEISKEQPIEVENIIEPETIADIVPLSTIDNTTTESPTIIELEPTTTILEETEDIVEPMVIHDSTTTTTIEMDIEKQPIVKGIDPFLYHLAASRMSFY